jgi:glutamate/aspartate transport system substrate-binding protein
MMRKDDDALAKVINATIADLVKSGEIYKLYDKWFLQPTVPSGAVVNLPMSNYLKEVLTKPNNLPAEEYVKKVS